MTSITFAAVTCDADELCSEKNTGSRVVFYNVTTEHDSAFILLNFGFSLRIFVMKDGHQCSKVAFLFVALCFQNNLPFALYFVQLPGWNRLDPLPLLVHCCFRIRNFHRLRHRNKFANQMTVTHRIVSFTCDVIFVNLW